MDARAGVTPSGSSALLVSNTCDMSRLQLAVELLQRVARMLTEEDLARCAERLAPYLRGSAGQYVYRVKGQEATLAQLQEIGVLLLGLARELGQPYAAHPAYELLVRYLRENDHLEAAPGEVEEFVPNARRQVGRRR